MSELTLSTHLLLGLFTGPFPFGLLIATLNSVRFSLLLAECSAHLRQSRRFQGFDYVKGVATYINFDITSYSSLSTLTVLDWSVYFPKNSVLKNPEIFFILKFDAVKFDPNSVGVQEMVTKKGFFFYCLHLTLKVDNNINYRRFHILSHLVYCLTNEL